VKPALVAFAGTVTVAGSVTAALLLARLTLSPPLGAAAVSVTVQASSTHPVVDVVVQVSVFNADVLAPNKARGKMLDNNISRPVRQWLRPHIWVRR
jgi:P pilus assembly chaperone PapD